MDLAALLGGIGLFLLGMSMMTDGLKLAAGSALKSILGSWTSSAGRGLMAGMLITAIVQSSSATIVAVIGFVNAGLLSLTQAIWVVFGANVGTTTTGWIVAIIGVRFSMSALGLPLVGLGMLVHLFFRDRVRLAGFGRALAGFGAFFIGIGMLQEAFGGIGFSMADLGIEEDGVLGRLAFVLAGIVLTLTTQSSSATIAITLTAVASDAMALPSAAAMIIGANIGTSSTAIFAALGGTVAARRTALSHVAFSLVAATAAFLLMPLFLWSSGEGLSLMGLTLDDPTRLAVFHTLLNVFGVFLIWPLAPGLIRVLSRLFASEQEEIARPRFLDANVAGTPDLAASGLYLETFRAIQLCMEFARDRLAGGPARPAAVRRRNIRLLMTEIRQFIDGMMSAQPLSEGPAQSVPELVRALQHGEELLVLPPEPSDDTVTLPLREALAECLKGCLTMPTDNAGGDDEKVVHDAHNAAENAYEMLKGSLLRELSAGQVGIEVVDRDLAWAQALKRMGYVACRARLRLLKARELTDSTAGSEGAPV